MGRTAMDDENRLLTNEEEEEEDEEEEALSLSDLPVHEELGPESKELEPPPAPPIIQLPDDDFDFGSATTEPEMCAADDVFFRGWILPLRHSVSSDSGLALLRADSQRTLSRSGSMDNGYQTHKSTIMRSSSTRSQYSSSCSSSRSSSTRTNNSTIPKLPKPSNPFQHYYYYTHRRPVPGGLNRASKYVQGQGQGQMMKSNNNNMWSMFRLGLVRTPTMEPLDIKYHGNNSRNPNQDQDQEQSLLMGKDQKDKKKHKFPYFGGGGCKCSAEAVVVPSRIASEKSGPKEKTKRDMSRRHRTYEWLKELSSVADDDEEGEQGRGRDRGNLGKVER